MIFATVVSEICREMRFFISSLFPSISHRIISGGNLSESLLTRQTKCTTLVLGAKTLPGCKFEKNLRPRGRARSNFLKRINLVTLAGFSPTPCKKLIRYNNLDVAFFLVDRCSCTERPVIRYFHFYDSLKDLKSAFSVVEF